MENEDVVIVQTMSPPQNENLVQLLLMADNAKDSGARSTTAVVPYFAYARQDKRFRRGEAFSVKTIVKVLGTCGIDRIITINSHNPATLNALSLPIDDLSAIGLLAQHFNEKGFVGAFSLSLGKKGLDTALEARSVLKGECGFVQTQRDRMTGKVTIEKKDLPVKNKDVIIFDDIISSGGTMIKAVAWVKQQQAGKIYVACVHPLLRGNAKKRILMSGADGIVGTDSVPSSISVVSVAPLIADALRKRDAQRG